MSQYPDWPPDSVCHVLDKPTLLPIDDAQYNALHLVLLIANIISIVANTFTVITYLLYKRTFPKSMPIFFGLASTGLHTFLLIGGIAGPEGLCANATLCKVQAAGIQFFGSATMWWFLAVSVNLHSIVITHKILDKYQIHFNVFCWGLAAIQTAIPTIANKLESKFMWCWISAADHGAWEFSLLYGEMAIVCIVAAGLWFRVIVGVCQMAGPSSRVEIPVRHILGVCLMCSVFIIMISHRIYNLVTGSVVFSFLLIHTMTLSSVGIIIFMAFGLSKDNLKNWKQTLCRTRVQEYEYEPVNS